MLKLGFIGCGGIARHHAKTIQNSVKGLRIAAGADVSADARKLFGETFHCSNMMDDYRDLLKTDIDAVCVALPTGLHADAVVAAAQAGKHVFCEKPMAMNLRDCDRMIAACDKARVKLMIGQVRRYDAYWGTFKKLMDSGAVGRPVLWRQCVASSGPGRWFMDAKLGGGPFIDGCVHNWDFANYCFGEPVEAIGSLMRVYQKSALDTGAMIVRYKSGDEIALSWSWGMPQGCRAGRVHEALGPKGVIQFPECITPEELPKDLDSQKHGVFMVDLGAKKRFVKYSKKTNMFAEEWKDFLGAVEKNREPKVTGAIGRKAAAVAIAVLKAGETRKPVKIQA
ncbi:MAG TPA: Gfo/Idh/MocA family oxidoreductase [Candidatus Brocadiia bacterium]|nr:Gfo/Idh/MocA family oxidoreductase [Candidatus Brocadiia bacterium]